jgi:uncharacterized membrane protein
MVASMTSYFSQFDSERIVQAIAAAESRSSAEIRVHVTRRVPKDLEERALRRFQLLGMTNTAERNGVLLYIAPRARQFRVLGDVGIHEKCGPEFWTRVAAAMEEHFRRASSPRASPRAFYASARPERHFPRRTDDRDELPNAIDEE